MKFTSNRKHHRYFRLFSKAMLSYKPSIQCAESQILDLTVNTTAHEIIPKSVTSSDKKRTIPARAFRLFQLMKFGNWERAHFCRHPILMDTSPGSFAYEYDCLLKMAFWSRSSLSQFLCSFHHCIEYPSDAIPSKEYFGI
ncbi:hypothetical protein [Brucella abortus]|uniref:hypothetical protein n=1 Tax=Brucella abortus TaxID=235 RepID=UPI0009ABF628